MTKREILLTILAEECVETAQRATKAIRFTLEEIQPNLEQNPEKLTNSERILYEFNDIWATLELLKEDGVFNSSLLNDEMINKKRAKLEKYLDYSTKLGTLI